MLISSKFPGVCLVCQKAINVGDRVSWIPGRKGAEHAVCSDEGKAVQEATEASAATDADIAIPIPDGLSYLGYQKAGIAYAIEKGNTLIADEMGLGKTIQALGYINARPEIRRVLVICPKTVKLNWRNECRKWLVRKFSIGAFPECKKLDGIDITIVNHDNLKKLPPEMTWDLMVRDEAHADKNPKTARSKAVKALRKRCTNVLALTGTPILNKPVELFPLLSLVCPEVWDPPGLKGQEYVGPGEGGGFFKFAKRYCNAHKEYYGRKSFWNFNGASNLPELQEKLRASCMVRRLKKDVLTELPAKRRQTIALKLEDAEDLLAEERRLFDTGILEDGDEWQTLARAKAKLAFEDISRTRRELALKKVPAVLEHVIEALETSEKIVLFAHHHEVIDALTEGLAEFLPARIDGRTPTDSRNEAVQRFQNDPTCRVIIGSIGAMGVGLTLTAASHVIFAELDWVPAMVSQAEDRCHRIGQRNAVFVQHLVIEGSLDSRMVELLIQKQEIADLALDTETLQDVSDRETVSKPAAPEVAPEKIVLVHRQLRFLADRCDGANREDGMGFNKLDAYIGKRLAECSNLSGRQALLGEKIVQKYRRQLEGMTA